MLFDSNDVTNRWVEHVTELYHDERGDPPDVSNEEIENVIKEMKCGKASGNDDIKKKGSFYIAQYPVRWTAQSALHFLPPLADLFIPTPTWLLREAF